MEASMDYDSAFKLIKTLVEAEAAAQDARSGIRDFVMNDTKTALGTGLFEIRVRSSVRHQLVMECRNKRAAGNGSTKVAVPYKDPARY
jgi:hypothetical protein